MTTIVRGHHFNTNDVATAFNLNKLVSGAILSDLPLESSVGGITVGTAPTETMQVGSLAAIYEAPLTSSNPSWSEYRYLIHTNEGLVALFNPLGLESRRFFTGNAALVPGSAYALRITGTGVPGATLHCTRSYTDQVEPRHHFLGSSVSTTNTAASNHMARLSISGVATTRIAASASSAQFRRRYFALTDFPSTGAWSSSGASHTDRTAGMALNIQIASDVRVVSWLFGGALYRT